MADRGNHYERAFETYLRSLRVQSIPVQETRRTFVEGQAVKSLDFLVINSHGKHLLVDIKGRKLVGNTRENWSTEEDLRCMARWEQSFGKGATALLVFVYHLPSESRKGEFADCFSHADRHYGCLAITIGDYHTHSRIRSPRWKTVSIPRADFDRHARPFSHWL